MRPRHQRTSDRREGGQALVEFAIVLIPFLIVMMGILDLARAIYMMNGTAEAARDIARVTTVHPFGATKDLGTSTDAGDVIATQRKLIPGLTIAPSTDIVCVDVTDAVVPDSECASSKGTNDPMLRRYVRVTVTAPFAPVTPLASMFGSHTFSSVSRIQVP
jgi:Flp pilus assembly protein TadG